MRRPSQIMMPAATSEVDRREPRHLAEQQLRERDQPDALAAREAFFRDVAAGEESEHAPAGAEIGQIAGERSPPRPRAARASPTAARTPAGSAPHRAYQRGERDRDGARNPAGTAPAARRRASSGRPSAPRRGRCWRSRTPRAGATHRRRPRLGQPEPPQQRDDSRDDRELAADHREPHARACSRRCRVTARKNICATGG